jgi:hypothetical protein
MGTRDCDGGLAENMPDGVRSALDAMRMKELYPHYSPPHHALRD